MSQVFSLGATNVLEGAPAQVTITRTGDLAAATLSLTIADFGGAALLGFPRAINLPAGSALVNVPVTLPNDNFDRPDRVLVATISAPSVGSIGTGTAQFVLADDEKAILGTEFRVDNGAIPANASDIDAVALPDGRLFVVWREIFSPPFFGSSTSTLFGRIVDPGASWNGDTFVIDGPPTGFALQPDLDLLADGRVVMAWNRELSNNTDENLRVQVIDPTVPFAPNSLAITLTGGFAPAVTALSNGQYLATWQMRETRGGTFSDGVQARLPTPDPFDNNLPFFVNTTIPGDQQKPRADQLADGRVLVVFESFVNGNIEFRGRFIGPAGALIGTDFLIPGAPSGSISNNFGGPIDVLALRNGKALIFGGTNSGFALIYDPANNTSTAVPLAEPSIGVPRLIYSIDAVELPDGRLALAYGGRLTDQLPLGLIVHLIDPENPAAAITRYVNPRTSSQNSVILSDLEVLANGDLALTWIEQNSPLGNGVFGVTFDPDGIGIAVSSAAAGEILTGSPFNDTLDGGAGADELWGGDGDDLLIGGPGDDRFEGGRGSDTASFVGATASVTINPSGTGETGAGRDTFNSVESIIGSAFNDDLTLLLTGFARGLSGNDTLRGGFGSSTLYGGDGDDRILDHTIATATAVYFGEAGNDVIEAFRGAATIDGGDGDDILRVNTATAGGLTSASIEGGLGLDILRPGGGGELSPAIPISGVEILETTTPGAPALALVARPETFELFDTIRANAANPGAQVTLSLSQSGLLDLADETAGRPVFLSGFSGADTLTTSDRNDTIWGAAGDDALFGGAGADALLGQDGADTLDGGTGANRMEGGSGDDTYIVRDAGDIVIELAANGFDRVTAHVPIALPANVEQLVFVGTGPIAVAGTSAANVLGGGAAADTLSGAGGDDFLIGGAGNDSLDGGDGQDGLFGGDGNDSIIGGAGVNIYDGGDGNDSMQSGLVNATESQVMLAGGGNDTGVGGAARDWFYGGDGDDSANGGGGSDFLVGEAGADLLNGEAGDDVLFGGDGNDTVNAGDGQDYLIGDAGNDSLNGGAGVNFYIGGEGNDRMSTDAANAAAQLFFGEGGDDAAFGGAGADYFILDAGNDSANGGAGNDVFQTGDGNDTLIGAAGDDLMFGGTGDNLYDPGAGTNYLILDGATDTIVIRPGEGTSFVYNFAPGAGPDVVRIEGSNFTSFAALQAGGAIADFSATLGFTAIRPGGGTELILVGVTPNQLTASDFVFG